MVGSCHPAMAHGGAPTRSRFLIQNSRRRSRTFSHHLNKKEKKRGGSLGQRKQRKNSSDWIPKRIAGRCFPVKMKERQRVCTHQSAAWVLARIHDVLFPPAATTAAAPPRPEFPSRKAKEMPACRLPRPRPPYGPPTAPKYRAPSRARAAAQETGDRARRAAPTPYALLPIARPGAALTSSPETAVRALSLHLRRLRMYKNFFFF